MKCTKQSKFSLLPFNPFCHAPIWFVLKEEQIFNFVKAAMVSLRLTVH